MAEAEVVDDTGPITIIPKIVRWGKRHGAISAKYGPFMGGGSAGKSKGTNSGPTGKRTARWYPDRAKRKALGKGWSRKKK
jgi:hypothetical protein